jgi:hypothetical protein
MRAVRRLPAVLALGLGVGVAAAPMRSARAGWPEAKTGFLEAMRSADWTVRKNGFVSAADHDGGDPVPALLTAMAAETNAAVVAAGLDVLEGYRSPGATAALTEAVSKGKPETRVLAAAALSTHKKPEVDAALAAALAAPDPRLVAQAALTLCQTGRNRTAATFLPLLAHVDRRVRGAGARALASVGDAKPALAPLAALLATESGRARFEVVRALEELSKQKLGDAPAKWKALAAGEDPAAVKEAGKPFPTCFGIPISGERVVFVLDRSLLMADAHPFDRKRLEALSTPPDGDPIPWVRLKSKLQVAVSQIEHAVDGLRPGTKFEVVIFAEDVKGALNLRLTPVSGGSKKALSAALAAIEVDDGINAWEALETAFGLGGATEQAAWKNGPDEVFLVINNIPNHGLVTDQGDAGAGLGTKARLRLTPIHVVGIGNHPYAFAEALAKRSGGTYLSLLK